MPAINATMGWICAAVMTIENISPEAILRIAKNFIRRTRFVIAAADDAAGSASLMALPKIAAEMPNRVGERWQAG